MKKAEGITGSYKSIHRAAKILICLSDGVYTITDIAKQCKLSKSTAYRLLVASSNHD